MKKIVLLLITLTAIQAHAQEMSGVYYDTRDGQEYETVIITFDLPEGVTTTREWFTSNLNYETDGSYCYKNYQQYCDTYGRLYDWAAAKKGCPSGWHISTTAEWELITKKYGGSKLAAGEMKEGGESGLAVLMSGFGEADGIFIDIGVNGYYWNTSSVNASAPGLITFHTGEDYFSDDQINDTHRNSVRCVRNEKQ